MKISIFLDYIKSTLVHLLNTIAKLIENKIRYVLVNGTKLMPIKMEFQFIAEKKIILTEIEFAEENFGI